MFPLMAIIFSSLLEVTILLHVSLLHNKIFRIRIHVLAILHILNVLHFSLRQIFSSPNRDELLRGASEYSLYFVVLAVGAGLIQFIGVRTLREREREQ